MKRNTTNSLLSLGLALVAVGCAAEAAELQVPLYDDLGSHAYSVTTEVPLAQRYFDQGLRLYYAFNHAEAIRAFEEAARLDPSCAMCYWGASLAYGPNINAAMDAAAGEAAYEWLQKARAAEGASEKERALIDALSARYVATPPDDRAALDSAYARAMGDLARRYPNDTEIASLYAESLMDLSPWEYWTHEGEARPQTPEILAQLERTIAANPSHPGACHFYIHAVEAAMPEKAVPCADRLASLMPGAGHLVHMPAHIYIRVGRWNDAIEANEHAVHADESYIQDQNPAFGMYTAGYYPHNYHFLAFAATMAGKGQQAVEASRQVVATIAPEIAVAAPDFEQLPAYLHLAMVTFGRWNEVLQLPMPPAQVPGATTLAIFARGVAQAATGDFSAAENGLAQVRERAAATPEGPLQPVMQIATHALAGEIAMRRGNLEGAEREFRTAAGIEDQIMYIEPPLWFYPIRHSLGKVLLEQGKAAEAEVVYNEDLERFPENGWSLIGLEQALRAQGRAAEADAVARRLATAWARADVKPASSRF